MADGAAGSRLRTRLASAIDHFEEIAGAAIVIGLALLAFANIIARYVLSYSLAFSEELEVTGLVWLTMFGAAVGFRRSAHIGFTILRDRLPRAGRRLAALASVAVTVGSAVVLVWGGIMQIRAERSLDTVSEALGAPQWLYTAAIPVGAALIALRTIQAARHDVDAA